MQLIATLLLSLLITGSIRQIVEVTGLTPLPWADDFNYESLDEMKEAGWTLDDGARDYCVWTQNGSVVLHGTGMEWSAIHFSGSFPSHVYDLRVECRGRWVGSFAQEEIGGIRIGVRTQRHMYWWYGYAHYWDNRFHFQRDDMEMCTFPNYTTQGYGVWVTISLEKRGNEFFLYFDGELKGSVILDDDPAPDAVMGVSLYGNFMTDYEFDYVTAEIFPVDLAVTDLIYLKTVIGQGLVLPIEVVVENRASHYEIFNVTLYANRTVIQTQRVVVDGENSATFSFLWNTSDWMKGNYTLKASATNFQGKEVDISDNTLLVDQEIFLTISGDVSGDLNIDIYDIVLIASAHGTIEGDPDYNANCDIDGDGDVDIFDIVAAAGHYGESW